jgi:hypothetical protein
MAVSLSPMISKDSAEKRELTFEVLRHRRGTPNQQIKTQSENWTSLLDWFYSKNAIQEEHGLVIARRSALEALMSTVAHYERGRCAELAKELGFEDVARGIEDRPAPVWRPKGGKTNAKAA